MFDRMEASNTHDLEFRFREWPFTEGSRVNAMFHSLALETSTRHPRRNVPQDGEYVDRMDARRCSDTQWGENLFGEHDMGIIVRMGFESVGQRNGNPTNGANRSL